MICTFAVHAFFRPTRSPPLASAASSAPKYADHLGQHRSHQNNYHSRRRHLCCNQPFLKSMLGGLATRPSASSLELLQCRARSIYPRKHFGRKGGLSPGHTCIRDLRLRKLMLPHLARRHPRSTIRNCLPTGHKNLVVVTCIRNQFEGSRNLRILVFEKEKNPPAKKTRLGSAGKGFSRARAHSEPSFSQLGRGVQKYYVYLLHIKAHWALSLWGSGGVGN